MPRPRKNDGFSAKTHLSGENPQVRTIPVGSHPASRILSYDDGTGARKRLRVKSAPISFTVEGKADGYYAIGKHPNWTRMKAYHAYRDVVRLAAEGAGLRLPLTASEEGPIHITTRLYASKRVHHDPENVHKGIVDALFYGAKGGDKHVGGEYLWATYGEGDRVVVTITFHPAQP